MNGRRHGYGLVARTTHPKRGPGSTRRRAVAMTGRRTAIGDQSVAPLVSVALSLLTLSLASSLARSATAAPSATATSSAPSASSTSSVTPATEVRPMPASWHDWNPTADPRAVVIAGQARFTILTPRLVRMEWSADGQFEDRASLAFVHRRLDPPAVTVSRTGGELILGTGSLQLRYRPGPGPFTPDNLEVILPEAGGTAGGPNGGPNSGPNGGPVVWRPGQTDPGNLLGTTRTLDSTNGAADVTLEPGILSRSGWALIDDSCHPLLDGGDPPWVLPRPPGERQDWYLFAHGRDFRGALHDFTRVAGPVPMPPRFALGYWWSRYWAYSDDELRELVAEMRGHGIPLDVLVVDMDWHTTEGLSSKQTARDDAGQMTGWTGYTMNRDLFPDPPGFFAWAREQGLRVALNLHPASGVPAGEERYADFARALGLDPAEGRAIPYALEDRAWSEAFFSTILRPLEAQGVDFWWLDWQAWRENRRVPRLDETFWLNHVFFSMAERDGDTRPLLFHRWGGLGNHRYQVGFSGDSFSTWEALAFQPRFTATASNVAYGWWSHDIGGHQGEDPDPELYLRWLQFGALSPILRTHSTKSLAIERRIWRYPEEFEAMRGAIRLRYALVPYLYTAAREAFDTGVSICRPLYYDHPELPEAYEAQGQYLLGDDLLVAPVTQKTHPTTGLATVRVWLPPGDWVEWASGARLGGGPEGRWIERAYPREEIPLFARAGAALPLYPPVSSLASTPDTIRLACMPMTAAAAEGSSAGRLYEDDGTTNAYRHGACAWTRFEQHVRAEARTVRIHPREGRFEAIDRPRAWQIELEGMLPPREIRVNGEIYPRIAGAEDPAPGTWVYDGATLAARLLTPPVDPATELLVEAIHAEPLTPQTTRLLDGAPGAMRRLARAMPAIKAEWNRIDPIANPPSAILRAGSMGRAISAEPQRATEILRQIEHVREEVIEALATSPAVDPEAMAGIAARIAPAGALPAPPRILLTPVAHGEQPVPDEERSRLATIDPPTRITLESPPGTRVVYTLDGSMPMSTSPRYEAPFVLERTARIRARALPLHGGPGSFPAEVSVRRSLFPAVHPVTPPSAKYAPIEVLLDGRFGRDDDFRAGWCGWEGNDLVLDLDPAPGVAIHALRLRFLRDQRNWIFLPARVAVEARTLADGSWRTLCASGSRAAAERRDEPVGVVEERLALHVPPGTPLRLRVENTGTVPAWHRGAGGRAWVFLDEIVAE